MDGQSIDKPMDEIIDELIDEIEETLYDGNPANNSTESSSDLSDLSDCEDYEDYDDEDETETIDADYGDVDLTSDLEVLLAVQLEGPKFFDRYSDSLSDPDIKNKLLNYHQLFLAEELDYHEPLNRTISYVTSKDKAETFVSYLKLYEQDDQFSLMDEIFVRLDEVDFETALYVYENIFIHFLDILVDDEFWIRDTGATIEDQSFLGKPLMLLDILSWDESLNKLYGCFKKMFAKSESFKNKFIETTILAQNLNIEKINLDISYDTTVLSSDIFLINLFGLLLRFFNDGVVDQKKINWEYIQSKNCSIRWYDKKDEEFENYTFTDICFFSVLNLVRICVVPIVDRAKTWPSIRDECIRILENAKKSIFQLVNIHAVKEELEFIEAVLVEDLEIISIKGLVVELLIFFDKFAKQVKLVDCKDDETDINIDDTLYDIAYIVKNTNINPIPPSIRELCIDVLKDNKLTNSVEIRSNMFNMLLETTYGYDESLQSIKIKDKKFVKNKSKLLVDSLVNLHNDIRNSSSSSYTKLKNQEKIYSFLSNLNFNYTEKSDLKAAFEADVYRTEKFANIMVNDAFDTANTLGEIYKSVENLPFGGLLDPRNSKKITYDVVHHLFRIIGHMMIFMTNYETFKDTIWSNPTYLALFVNKLVDVLTRMNLSLNFVDKTYKSQIANKHNDEIVCIEELVYRVLCLCVLFGKCDQFANYIRGDVAMFNINYYVAIKLFFDSSEIVESVASKEFDDDYQLFIEKLSQSEDEHDNYELDDIPSDFIDPLTYQPIKDPVLLPRMVTIDNDNDMFLERTSIKTSLLNKEENPFTRDPLTLKELEEFNNKDEIVKKLDDFKSRFNGWKQGQK